MNARSIRANAPVPVRPLATLAMVLAAGAAQGAITLSTPVSLATPQRPDGVAIGDWDRDGDNDAAIVTDAPDKITIFFNTGNGSFGPAVNVPLPAGSGAGALAMGDWDRDGDLDLAVALKNSNQVRIVSNAGGAFTPGATFATGALPVDLRAADIDSDGDLDLVTANRDGNSATLAFNTAGTFGAASYFVGLEPRQVALADVDSDGDADLAVSLHEERLVRLYRNAGNGGFAIAQTLTVAGERPEGVGFADITRDGKPELFATYDNDTLGALAVYANVAGTLATNPVSLATNGQNPGFVLGADLDGDADLDIVVANEDSASIAIFQNSGTGTLAPAQTVATGLHPSRIAAERLNTDAALDMLVSNRDSNTSSSFFGGGGGPGPNPTCDDIDFNNDGVYPDLVDVAKFLEVFAGGSC